MTKKTIYKIIALSSSSAGLTTFLSQNCQKFDSITSLHSPYSIGIDYYSKDIALQRGTSVTLHFWKLWFKKRFNFFLKDLIKDADAGIFMFDIRNKNSLYNIKVYVSIFRSYDSTLPIILIGNKIDLVVKTRVQKDYID